MKSLGITVAVLVGLAVLIGGGLGLRWLLAEPSGAVQQREMTVGSGAYRIAAYDQFFQECHSAKTVQQNLAVAITAASAEGSDPGRRAQLDANVIALTSQLNDAVNTYNAHAAQADTRARFKASDLPYELVVNPADPTTPAITCTA